jgi:ABC-2 type transport system ATP-binding protein
VSHAIEITSLRVNFADTVAVADVSLTVDFGEIHVVLGPNGAGKTTTVETLLGFRRPSGGTVRVVGLDPVRDHAEVVTRTGALLQRGGVWFPMCPRDALNLTASYYGATRPLDELIDQLSLARCARTPWRRLSGGEQQRTLLALALIGRPKVLVLDEPTSAVDPEGHLVVRELLARERERGCALLVTTHQLDDAESIADRVTIIDEGESIATGSPAELAGPSLLVVETSSPIDATALAVLLDAPVEVVAPTRLRIGSTNSPEIVAAVTKFVHDAGAELVALRSRASLEESYLRLLDHHRQGRTR